MKKFPGTINVTETHYTHRFEAFARPGGRAGRVLPPRPPPRDDDGERVDGDPTRNAVKCWLSEYTRGVFLLRDGLVVVVPLNAVTTSG